MNYSSIEETKQAIEAYQKGNSVPICNIAASIADGLCRKIGIRDREDITQDAVLLVLEKMKNYRSDRGLNPFNYLTTIIYNLIRATYRKQLFEADKEHRLAALQANGEVIRRQTLYGENRKDSYN